MTTTEKEKKENKKDQEKKENEQKKERRWRIKKRRRRKREKNDEGEKEKKETNIYSVRSALTQCVPNKYALWTSWRHKTALSSWINIQAHARIIRICCWLMLTYRLFTIFVPVAENAIVFGLKMLTLVSACLHSHIAFTLEVKCIDGEYIICTLVIECIRYKLTNGTITAVVRIRTLQRMSQ